MEKQGTKVVPIANTDVKWQLTAVLTVTAGSEYLKPQLLYKGKTKRCLPTVAFPEGWDIWHSENRWSNEDTTKRYIRKTIVPFCVIKEKRFEIKINTPCYYYIWWLSWTENRWLLQQRNIKLYQCSCHQIALTKCNLLTSLWKITWSNSFDRSMLLKFNRSSCQWSSSRCQPLSYQKS